MKTIKEVELDIEKAKEELAFIRKTKEGKGETAISNKIKTMRIAKNYLEFNPTIETIEKFKTLVNKHLAIYESRYLEFKKQNEKIIVTKAMFHRSMEVDTKEVSKWNDELKFINYLLS